MPEIVKVKQYDIFAYVGENELKGFLKEHPEILAYSCDFKIITILLVNEENNSIN